MDLLFNVIAIVAGFLAGLMVAMELITYKIKKGHIPRFLADLGVKKRK